MDNRIASDQIVPERETLTVAFQQDFEDKASDGALIETVVGMANAEGGTLYIGVGEEGRIFGVRTEAGNNPEKAVAFIASHTVPPLIVSAESEEVEGKKIWVVRVPKAEGIVAAQDGKVLKRRLGVGKKPGTFPLYPPEFVSRLSDIGRLDFSAMILSGTSTDDLDDLEREGLRAFMWKNRAEKGLADLEDSEFDKALGVRAGNTERYSADRGGPSHDRKGDRDPTATVRGRHYVPTFLGFGRSFEPGIRHAASVGVRGRARPFQGTKRGERMDGRVCSRGSADILRASLSRSPRQCSLPPGLRSPGLRRGEHAR